MQHRPRRPAGQIRFKSGYKHILVEPYALTVGIIGQDVGNEYVRISPPGVLSFEAPYAWDGLTGAVDTRTGIRGSLIHDGLYQLLREGLPQRYRLQADRELLRACREDGMAWVRAQYIYRLVRVGASHAARPGSGKRVRVAP